MFVTLSFGHYLKKRLKELNITQEELAKKVGVAHFTVAQWTTDRAKPGVQYVSLLAATLKTTENKVYLMMGVKVKRTISEDFLVVPIINSHPPSWYDVERVQEDELIISPNLLPMPDPEHYHFFACVINGSYYLFTPDIEVKHEDLVIIQLPKDNALTMMRYLYLDGSDYFNTNNVSPI
jgi:transcriptional regulator with XRE-family HTH domain